MTIFDYLKDIVSFKKGDLSLEGYVPFLINRWLSFLSPSSCFAINESVNSLGNIDKDIHYKLLISCFPKQKYMSKINYIKKVKIDKEDQDNKISILAKTMELSQKEIQQMVDFNETINKSNI
jgi:hypothetical protein